MYKGASYQYITFVYILPGLERRRPYVRVYVCRSHCTTSHPTAEVTRAVHGDCVHAGYVIWIDSWRLSVHGPTPHAQHFHAHPHLRRLVCYGRLRFSKNLLAINVARRTWSW